MLLSRRSVVAGRRVVCVQGLDQIDDLEPELVGVGFLSDASAHGLDVGL